MPDDSMDPLVKPTILKFVQSHKIVLMKDEVLLVFAKAVFSPDVIHEVSMDSFRRPCKSPKLTILK